MIEDELGFKKQMRLWVFYSFCQKVSKCEVNVSEQLLCIRMSDEMNGFELRDRQDTDFKGACLSRRVRSVVEKVCRQSSSVVAFDAYS